MWTDSHIHSRLERQILCLQKRWKTSTRLSIILPSVSMKCWTGNSHLQKKKKEIPMLTTLTFVPELNGVLKRWNVHWCKAEFLQSAVRCSFKNPKTRLYLWGKRLAELVVVLGYCVSSNGLTSACLRRGAVRCLPEADNTSKDLSPGVSIKAEWQRNTRWFMRQASYLCSPQKKTPKNPEIFVGWCWRATNTSLEVFLKADRKSSQWVTIVFLFCFFYKTYNYKPFRHVPVIHP